MQAWTCRVQGVDCGEAAGKLTRQASGPVLQWTARGTSISEMESKPWTSAAPTSSSPPRARSARVGGPRERTPGASGRARPRSPGHHRPSRAGQLPGPRDPTRARRRVATHREGSRDPLRGADRRRRPRVLLRHGHALHDSRCPTLRAGRARGARRVRRAAQRLHGTVGWLRPRHTPGLRRERSRSRRGLRPDARVRDPPGRAPGNIRARGGGPGPVPDGQRHRAAASTDPLGARARAPADGAAHRCAARARDRSSRAPGASGGASAGGAGDRGPHCGERSPRGPGDPTRSARASDPAPGPGLRPPGRAGAARRGEVRFGCVRLRDGTRPARAALPADLPAAAGQPR
jgi:hypothetical protein